jgi:hypothetical protein
MHSYVIMERILASQVKVTSGTRISLTINRCRSLYYHHHLSLWAARVSGLNNGVHNVRWHLQVAERQPKTTFKFQFQFLFVPILRPFCLPRTTHIPGGFKRSTMFAINTTTASGQPVRFFFVSVDGFFRLFVVA